MWKAVAGSGGKMPTPRLMQGVERLGATLTEAELFARFMCEFIADQASALFVDARGESLVIDRGLFTDLRGNWKIQKGERATWLLYTAVNIRQPDEIWLEPGRSGGEDKRYYLSRFVVGRRGLLACVAVFARKPGMTGAWSGVTNYATTREDDYLATKRGREGWELKHGRWER